MNMKVNIAQVRRKEGASARFERTGDFSAWDLGIEGLSFQAPLHVQLQVNNVDKRMLVYGNIQTELKATCGRCLETYVHPLSFPFQDEWAFRTQATEDMLETVFLLDQDEVDITERIFEQIVLALPMKFTCSPDCRGLCAACGANRNLTACQCTEDVIDPRLAALKEWQANE